MSFQNVIAHRSASVNIDQLPNGYWRCEVTAYVPGLGPLHDASDSFHNAGECLDWANATLRNMAALAGGWLG